MMGEPIQRTSVRELLRERRAELLAAAALRGASNLRVFGSAARGDDGAESDVDFLVDFEASRSLVDVAGLILDLQEILGIPVDLVEASTLRPGDEDILADAVALESA
ncbi:MAG TPA: nucleotidyltransferase family protein [Actinomycetota bacterium]|nr:nucleotidyltransferase family protein [Actinomycetota bacterium]